MCSISVALPREGLRTRVTLFRAEIERFWLGFAKQSDQNMFFKQVRHVFFPTKIGLAERKFRIEFKTTQNISSSAFMEKDENFEA